jgi:hypothetical protein
MYTPLSCKFLVEEKYVTFNLSGEGKYLIISVSLITILSETFRQITFLSWKLSNRQNKTIKPSELNVMHLSPVHILTINLTRINFSF